MQAGRVLALGFVAVALAACQPGPVKMSKSQPAAEVLGGALTLRPPRGYCIDRSAGSEVADAAVVLMGRCADTAPVVPAVLTLTVAEAGSAAVLAAGGQALADYFTSDAGRAAVARSGRAGDVRVLEAFGAGEAFYLHLADREAGNYWRAVLGAKGRLVTVSVTPPEDVPLAPDAGRALLDEVLTGLARANRG